MSSSVTFKKHQGTSRDQCFFHGDGIKLIELKRNILSQEADKGKSTGSLDFDYEIKDENTSLGTRTHPISILPCSFFGALLIG